MLVEAAGASAAAAWRLSDSGYFGAGVYLTPQAGYACDYASGASGHEPRPQNDSREWVLLLCADVLGNAYPVSRRTDYDRPNDLRTVRLGFTAHIR